MHIHIVDLGTIYMPQITKLLLRNINGVKKITIQPVHEPQIGLMNDADLIILTGGTWMVRDNPGTHLRLMKKVIESGKPTLGICLGAESIASYFNGEIVPLDARISGLVDIELIDERLQAVAGGETATVYAHHAWSVISLPDDFRILAQSDSGIEGFAHATLPIIGLQFHPETRRSLNMGASLFSEAIREIIPN